jgi:centrosomal protein POC5
MSRPLITDHPINTNLEDLEHINFLDHNRDHTSVHDTYQVNRHDNERLESNTVVEERKRNDGRPVQKRFHQLQVLDEDAENFKVKLDNLLGNFRAETLSEFMAIKRVLLEEQANNIESETRRLTKLVEQKTNDLDKTKEALAVKTKQHERGEVITNVMAGWLGTARTKRKNHKMLSKYFNGLKLFRRYMVFKRKIIGFAKTNHKKTILKTVFNGWKDDHYTIKEANFKKEADENLNRELSELAAKYNKEIDLLSSKLNEANKLVEESNRNKADMQENLKKAFMRGVCALNFEAMNILQPSNKIPGLDDALADKLISQTTMLSAKVADLGAHIATNSRDINSLLINPVDDFGHLTGSFAADQRRQADKSGSPEKERELSPKKNVVFYQAPRPESKETKWKEAPIIGSNVFAPSSSKTELRRSPEKSYYNKENDMETNNALSSSLMEMKGAPEENEGKIIKVNNGKSYVAAGTLVGKDTKKAVHTPVHASAKDSYKATKTEEKVTLTTGKNISSIKSQLEKAKNQLKKQ